MKDKLFVLLAISMSLVNNLNAQGGERFTEVQFLTEDSVRISASYQLPAVQTKSSPAVILIHQGGSSRQEWFGLSLVKHLHEEGYAILAYDVRGHGKSAKDEGSLTDLFNNPNRAPLDLLAATEFLQRDKRIDAGRIGILGASIGANLACMAAASDKYNVKSVVSISAKTSAAQNLSGMKEQIRPRTAFHIASKEEQGGQRDKWAHELYAMTTGEKKVEISDGSKHGSFILRESKSLEKSILAWFRKTL